MHAKCAISAKVAAFALAPVVGIAGTAAAASAAPQPGQAPRPPAATVTLKDQAGQYVQVNARGQVSMGRHAHDAAKFIKVNQPHGQYELKYGQGRNAKYLTVSHFGASLGRQGTHFATGQPSRVHGYSTIKINRDLLTAQGARLTEAPQGRHGPTASQEWANIR